MMAFFGLYSSAFAMLAPLIGIVGIGVVWAKRDYPFAGSFITVLVTSVTTPALVFHTLVTTDLPSETLLLIVGSTVGALALGAAISVLILKCLGMPVRKLLLLAAFPNAGNLGLPLTQMVFGDEGLSASIAFFAVSSFLMHTLGVRSLPGAHAAGAWKSPILLACLAAALVRLTGVDVPVWLLDMTRILGAVTVPLMLISLGHALALIPTNSLRTGAVVGTIRLSVGLFVGYVMVAFLPLSPQLNGALAMQMTMPCAVVSYMYIRRYTDQHEVAAGAVMVSTVLYVVLLPFLIWSTTP